jgi:arylsulfatase A-like enzyme
LLLVVDSVRADVLGKSKHRRRLPVLSALSKNSAYFSEARAPGSSTAASMASLFTGRYISELYWSGPARLEEPAPRLAEMLSEAGVQTVSLHGLRRISVASGIGRGFSSEVMRKRRASQLVDEVIDITRKSKGSLFLYAHFAEPHAPYAGKGPPFQRYLREVRRVDKELGRLFDFLSTSGLQKNSVVIVTSDHGEAFGEHGMNFHARLVYEEVLRVPLLIHGPGIAARTIEQPVTLVDLGPTVLDLFELPTPGVFKGQSLAPLLAGGSRALDRPLASEASRGIQTLLLPSGLKVIHDVRGRTVEVYDLGRDPAERVNLLETGDPKVASAVETTRLFFEVHRLRRPGYKPPRPF